MSRSCARSIVSLVAPEVSQPGQSPPAPFASVCARSGAPQPPVAMHAARAGRLEHDVRRLAAQQPSDHRQAVASVDVDPQPVGVVDMRLGGPSRAAHGRPDADLVARFVVAGDEREQRLQPPLFPARAAGQEVAGVLAGRDPQLAARRARPRADLDEAVAVAVQQAEVDAAVALAVKRALMDAPVGKSDLDRKTVRPGRRAEGPPLPGSAGRRSWLGS